jgi:hypothetical protein
VTDNLTGLIWLKNANAFGGRTWAQALTDCNTLTNGMHGLTDGSVAGDWRLPHLRELQSLIDYGKSLPPLPSGHPFTGAPVHYYWSSTSVPGADTFAWDVGLYYGNVNRNLKTTAYYIWPVRGGQ